MHGMNLGMHNIQPSCPMVTKAQVAELTWRNAGLQQSARELGAVNF